jgi:glycosyltransferase involved in cell wall biosynthesis
MKIIYISDIRMPTEKAHGLQIMKTSESLGRLGHEVVLYIPDWNSATEKEILDYYGLSNSVSIKKVKSWNLIKLGALGFKLRSYFFSYNAQKILYGEKFDVIYTRDEVVAQMMLRNGDKVFFEMHDVREGLQRKVLQKATGIVCITGGLREYCVANGVPAERITVIPDAVDPEIFFVKKEKNECREILKLQQNKKIVLYAGHLYKWKGVYTLAQASVKFDANVLFVFVGGTPHDLSDFKKECAHRENVLILGHKKHETIPLFLRAADVLVLPNSAKEDISRLYTSPVKMFEYMASGTPIVASDLPSIREILSEQNAFFAEADNAESFAEAIKLVLDNPDKADILSDRALDEVKKYTWQKRAESISRFISYRIVQ